MTFYARWGETKTRYRKVWRSFGKSKEIWIVNGVTVANTPTDVGYLETQKTVSRDNLGWQLKKRILRKKHTGYSRRIGPGGLIQQGGKAYGVSARTLTALDKTDLGNGQFTTHRKWVEIVVAAPIAARWTTSTQLRTASGTLFPIRPDQGPFPSYPTIDESQLWAKGGKAIAGVRPTDPNSSLLVFLGEVKREGIPSLSPAAFKDKISFFRSLGNDYLNLEFGWKPFISELRSIAKSVSSSDEVIRAYAANADRPVRTRYTFPDSLVETNPATSSAYGWPGFHTNLYQNPGVLSRWTSQSTKTWFEGVFRYHLSPDLGQMAQFKRNSQLANKLLGTRLTPEVLWNLTPWSWLVDWVIDIGTLVGNLSYLGQDGLVMQYGYIMQNGRNSTHYHLNGLRYTGSTGYLVSQLNQHAEYKLRRAASPYGFGLNLDGFSAKQWSILSALGIAKGPGSVRYN
jgi:hypothetical protein